MKQQVISPGFTKKIEDTIGTVPSGETVQGEIDALNSKLSRHDLTTSSSINDITDSGVYYIPAGTSWAPDTSAGYTILSVKTYNNMQFLLAAAYAGSNLWFCNRTSNSAYSAWKKLAFASS